MKTLAAIIFTITLNSTAFAFDWYTGFRHGKQYYGVTNKGGSFSFWCDINSTDDASETGIILLNNDGDTPRKNEIVNVILDGTQYQVFINEYSIGSTHCRACGGNFRGMWEHIRRAQFMLVQFSNHENINFSLNKAREVLPAKPCDTEYSGRTNKK